MRENGSNGSIDHLPTPGNDYLNFRAVLQARQAAQQHNLQPASARHVLEVVAGFTNGNPARPSYDTLASITGLGTYQVRRLIDALVEAGYLTETREPRKGGGWGKPKWALGHACQVLSEPHMQVVPEPHMSQEQVLPTPHSSVATATLASVATATPKRNSVHSVHSVETVKRSTEEKGAAPLAPAPAPKPAPKPGNGRVASMIDALRDVKLPDKLTPQERSALLDSELPVEEIAACMAAISARKLGDQWDRDHLTVNQGIKLHRGWKSRQSQPAPRGGVTGAFVNWANTQPEETTTHAHDHRPIRRPLPPPGSGL